MIRGQAVSRVQQKLGFSTVLASQIATALQDAQTELEHDVFLPRFLQGEATLATVASTATVALPTDFLREYEQDGPLWYLDASLGEHELVKDDAWFLRQSFLGSEDVPTTGVPRGYALAGANIRLFPTPDAVYSLRLAYYKAEPALSADSIENKWLINAHELLIGMAGKEIAEAKRDLNGVVFFTNMEARGRKKLYHADEARDHENRRYVMGGED